MSARRPLHAALLALALLRSGVAAAGEPATAGEEEISVKAQSLDADERTNTVRARGDVIIRRGETELRADEVVVNRTSNEAEATGHVTLTGPEGALFADRMRLDLDQETGLLEKARIESSQAGYSLTGDRIEKGVGHRYHIENGYFTTCRCAEGPPSWSIATESLDVALDGYGFLREATFNILDVPILYLPRAAFPVNRDRHSGLLFPRVGFSNRRGFQLLQPFFWDISKSQDATVAVDIETSARLGLVGEYRYALSPTFHGALSASYFNEAIRGRARESSTGRTSNPDVPEDRWGVFTQHSQSLLGADAYADLLLVGDDLFLREINAFTVEHDEDVKLRTKPFTESRIGAVRRWDRVALQFENQIYQDLIGRDSLALQRVPELRATAQKRLGLGFLGSFDASATDFQRSRGIAGLRADLQPGVEWRAPLGRSLRGLLSATFRETAYQLTENEMTRGFRGDCTLDPADPERCLQGDPEDIRLPGSTTRETVELRAHLGTEMSRVFAFNRLGVARLKHTIEPLAEYLYIPNVSQDDVMVFDGIDRIAPRNLVTYGVVSRLMARQSSGDGITPGDVRELFRFSASQSYSLDERVPTAGQAAPLDHLSDIDFGLRVKPSRSTAVRAATSYDTARGDLTTASIGIRFSELLGASRDRFSRVVNGTTLGVVYRFVTNNPLAVEDCSVGQSGCGVEQVDSTILLRLNDRIAFRYSNRYNIDKDQFLENHYGVKLVSSCDCWSVDLGVTDRSNPDEIELHARITLLGLGSSVESMLPR